MSEENKNTPETDEDETVASKAAGEEDIGEVVEETAEEARDRLAAELAEFKDKFLRTMADVENARTRHMRELEDARKYASTGFARDLLDVVDNLGRALAAVPGDARQDNKLLDDLVIGVEMTERTLLNAFDKHKIKKISPNKGDKFDHKQHQAMFEVPTNELPSGHIADVMQPGYMIADRLLRAAMVGVTKAAPQPAAQAAPGDHQDQPPGTKIDTSA